MPSDPQPAEQTRATRGPAWAAIGRTCLIALIAGAGTALAVAAALDGRALLAVSVTLLSAGATVGALGRFGIPVTERRSRLPVALQGVLLGASATAVLVALVEVRAWGLLAAVFWLPTLFPEAVPASVFRRMMRRAEKEEDHVPSGPRWQDRPLGERS